MTGAFHIALAMGLLIVCCLLRSTQAGPAGEAPAIASQHLLEPFWANRSDTMHGEGLLFIQRPAGRPEARLLFTPDKMIAVRSATGEVTYEEGRDYEVIRATRTIRLPEGSRIPFVTQADLYPPADSPAKTKISAKRGDPKRWLLFSEGAYFHRLAAEATYTHRDRWTATRPDRHVMPGGSRTVRKLRAGQPVTIFATGDSITVGGNASGLTKAPPFVPPYPGLVVAQLADLFKGAPGARVAYRNVAVGGTGSAHGLANVGKVAASRPDLVIIGFGMNDTALPTERYRQNIAGIMAAVRASNPEAEFVLVASMVGNAEWTAMRMESFPEERDALASLCGPGVAMADLTALWQALLSAGKGFHDMTGNGVNHANDWGHRLYAQAVLSVLLGEDTGR